MPSSSMIPANRYGNPRPTRTAGRLSRVGLGKGESRLVLSHGDPRCRDRGREIDLELVLESGKGAKQTAKPVRTFKG